MFLSLPDSMRPDVPEMNTVLLNSYWFEVGERSFMKEAVAYQVGWWTAEQRPGIVAMWRGRTSVGGHSWQAGRCSWRVGFYTPVATVGWSFELKTGRSGWLLQQAGSSLRHLLSVVLTACVLQVMADEGVIAPLNQYVQVYLNGQFYGLYGLIEKVRGC